MALIFLNRPRFRFSPKILDFIMLAIFNYAHQIIRDIIPRLEQKHRLIDRQQRN